MKGLFSKINILEAFRQAKRPFACLLVLCLTVTMMPIAGINIVPVTETFADTEVAALQFSGSQCTISEDTVLTAAQTISDNSTLRIEIGCTLTLRGVLTLGNNVNVNGGGKIVVAKDTCIWINGNVSISNITIEGDGETSSVPLIVDQCDSSDVNIVLDSVTITGAKLQANMTYPSVFYFNMAETQAHNLYLRGNTTIINNEGGLVGAIGCRSNLTSVASSKIFVQDGVIVKDNTNDSGKANIRTFRSDLVEVSGNLYAAAEIGVTAPGSNPSAAPDYNNAFAVKGVAVTQSDADVCDAFFMDDFHGYGVTMAGMSLKPIAKSTMQFTVTGSGIIEATDERGRDIIQTSTASVNNARTFTIREVAGRTVNLKMIADDEDHFIKTVTISNTDRKGDIATFVGGGLQDRFISFGAFNNNNNGIVFEEAITAVTIAGIVTPYDLLKVEDSLKELSFGSCDPGSASVTVKAVAWKAANSTAATTSMGATDTFTSDTTYKLWLTLEAENGSQFAGHVNVSAADGSNTCVAASDTLTVAIERTATRMPLSVAEGLHLVTISAVTANTVYSGQSYGPVITIQDSNGGSISSTSYSATVDGTGVTVSASGSGIKINGPAVAKDGNYSANITIETSNYEGTKTFTGLTYRILKKHITPTAIDITGASKYYDGTTAVTAGAITFDGLIGSDALTKGTDYTATFAFDQANAGTRSVVASDITLTSTEVASNYVIDSSVNSFTQTGVAIAKATPVPSDGSLVYDLVNAPGKKLSEINFHLGTLFRNPYKTSLTPDVDGTLGFTELNPGTVEILKNQPYGWKFTPNDTTNYNEATGAEVFWPVAPIKSISFAGITLPTAGAANNLTTNAVSGVTVTSIGPSLGCEITVASAEWKEYNPNTNSTSAALGAGYTFRYNRTYTLELTLNASASDKFATGAGILAVDFTTDGANYIHMTSVTVSETQAKFKYSVVIDKGTLTADMFTVPANQSVIYDGQVHYCTIASISAALNDGYLEYRTATNGAITNATWTSYAGVNANAGLSGYRDASASPQTYQIEIRHPDYTATSPITRTYNIAIGPKAINTISIAAITKKPYDTTTAVNVTLSSVDIINGDAVTLTAGTATISNPNCTTSSVTVNANGITKTGADSGNYNLVATTATTSGALNVIQKVTPTGGSITYSAVTIINPKFSNIGVTPQGFKNEYIENAALNDVAGTIISSRNAEFTQTEDNDSSVRKRFEYWWKFVPNDSDNYNEVTGRAVYWPGSPLTIATLTGITLPAPNAVPTAKESINLAINDPTADVTISAIAWYESAPNDAEHAGVTERALSATDKFYYNRYHTLVITLSAVGTPDEFNADGNSTTPTFAGIIDISGDTYRCTTALQTVSTTDGDKYQIAVITCDFQKTNSSTREITAKGTLTLDNLEFRDFASYLEQNGTTAYSDGLRGEYTGQNVAYSYAYVYTGRWVGPNPKVYGLNVSNADVQSVQAPELAKFTYSLDGGVTFSATPPRYKNKMDPQQIRIKLEHPDYDSVGDVYKDVNFQIGPCTVRPEGIVYTGKGYDGTEEIVGAKLLWYPQSSGYDGVSTQAISEDLIDYTADFIFDGANVAPTKNIRVTNVDATSENFICQIDNLPAKNIAKDPLRNDAFTYTGGMLIRPATVKPKNNTILTKSVGSAVTLSAIYDEYITPVQNDSTSNAAIMVNENNTALTVYGILGFDNDTSTGFLSTASMDAITVVQGQSYTWRFVPNDGTNYAVTTGTQLLWPFPPPTPSYGGGGGGGAAPAPTKAAVSTLSGVIATPGSFSTQIHVYLASGGSIVTDKAFFARVTGAAVDRALTAMPDGNVVVDRDGNIIAKAIIADGKLKAYLIGDNYLTIQRRKVDYIDVPGHWFEPYVDFCSVRDIMNGTGENKFSPNDTLTRAMAATILYRLEGSQTLTASNTRRFADVDDGKWYTDGIAWAGGTGIVNGIGIKNFAPHWDITREQMAVMIYNYCCTMCGAQPVPSGSLDRSIYGDGNKIASWAQDAVAYCTKVGLMKGNDKGDFCPKDTATRAEFATIIERLIEGFLDGNL